VLVSRLWPLVLVAALGVFPIGPQEHVHETTDADGHHTLIAHRHTELHGLDVQRLGHQLVVDHPDPITMFPDGSYTAPASYVFQSPAVATVLVLTAPVPPVIDHGPRASDQLIHAPPRAPSSLRAPPSSSLL
jgi:hypothetical protein